MRFRGLDDTPCCSEVIKSVFLDQLPAATRSILAFSRVTRLQELADLANKVYESNNASYACSESSPSAPVQSFESQLSEFLHPG